MTLRHAQSHPGESRDPVPARRARVSVIASLCLLALTACGESAPQPPKLPPLQPDYAADLAPDHRAWADKAWPKVLATCAGLRGYREDLSPVPAGSRLVERYFEDRDSAMVIAIQVAERPAWARVKEFAAQGHRCEFAIEYPTATAVQIGRRWCQQLCLDRPIDSSGEDLRLGLK